MCIRDRYIGSTDEKGLHHLLMEVVDNSIDEALAGVCKNIIVKLYPDGSASVEDDGRGIPVDIHPIYNKPALEIVLTELHSGAKFDKKVYRVSGGLHGVGIHVVNFLSEYFRIIVKRDGKIYSQEYERGQKKSDIIELGSVGTKKINENIELELDSQTGTFVYFRPDHEIFETKYFNYDVVKGKLRSLAFLNKGLRIVLRDLRSGNAEEFKYDGGITEFVKFLNEGVQTVHPDVANFYDEEGPIQVEVALQYNDQTYETLLGYVNDIQTEDGGTHIVGFKTGLTLSLIHI